MRIFIDLEFTGLHQETTPISLGMIAEDGRGFYAEFTDYDREQIDPWISENVLPHLLGKASYRLGHDVSFASGNRAHIKHRIVSWFAAYPQVEIWGDVPTYDWVVFCELFGGALSLPSWVYYIPFDLATLLECRGIDPDINREEYANLAQTAQTAKHNALWDARIIRACYFRAMGIHRD